MTVNKMVPARDTVISLHTPVIFGVLQEKFQFWGGGFLVSSVPKSLSPPGEVSILGVGEFLVSSEPKCLSPPGEVLILGEGFLVSSELKSLIWGRILGMLRTEVPKSSIRISNSGVGGGGEFLTYQEWGILCDFDNEIFSPQLTTPSQIVSHTKIDVTETSQR